VVQRIWSTYGIAAEVVHPPVDVTRGTALPERDDFYLVVSRLSPYKRIDLAVDAFNRLGKRLVIVGDGPDAQSLAALAGPTVSLRGLLSDADVSKLYERARGFILPGEEDFGITPLEANAAGCPVIAFAAGGALDTVIDGQTGVHFTTPDAQSLAAAVLRAESIRWDVSRLRAHAEQFGEAAFRVRMREAIAHAVATWSTAEPELLTGAEA
jgi:glycosyltransferase involved in cell wall biosynthesis